MRECEVLVQWECEFLSTCKLHECPCSLSAGALHFFAKMTPVDWLAEEYKILQSKIDKIGEDRFKVRTWSVTIALGFVLGEKVFSAIPPVALLLAFPTVGIFHLLEHRQRDLGRKLGKRARQIEYMLKKYGRFAPNEKITAEGRSNLLSLHYIPGIANLLFGSERAEKATKFPWSWFKHK